MEFNKLPNAEVEERLVAPSGTTDGQQSSPKDGELYVDTDLKILKVGVGGSYQQMNGLPIGDEQTTSGTIKGGYLYPVNTSNGAVVLTIQAGLEANTRVGFFDPEGSWGTNAFTLQGDGETINGSTDAVVFALSNDSVTYVKSTGSRGWRTLASTGDTGVLKGWENVKTLTGSSTLAETNAYLLDLNATITMSGSTVTKLNVDYARKSGTRDFGDLTTTGRFYWQNADNTDIIVAQIEEGTFKGWVVGESNSSGNFIAQRGNAPIASPLGIVNFQSAAESTFNNDIVAGGFVKNTYTFTLPDTATDQSAIFVGDQYGACGYGCTVNISSSTQTFNLNEPYQYMVFQYDEANTQWIVTQGGVLNHVSGDSNTPETISGTTVNDNTGYVHTHELTLATSDEISDFSSSNPASLEQIRQALALRGIMWTPNTDDPQVFPEDTVNNITVPSGDYRVDSTVSDGPETNGIVYQRYINANTAIQLFQGYDNNTLYIRNYPTTTDWLQIASETFVTDTLASFGLNGRGVGLGTVTANSEFDDAPNGFINFSSNLPNGGSGTAYGYQGIKVLSDANDTIYKVYAISYAGGGKYFCYYDSTDNTWTRVLDTHMAASWIADNLPDITFALTGAITGSGTFNAGSDFSIATTNTDRGRLSGGTSSAATYYKLLTMTNLSGSGESSFGFILSNTGNYGSSIRGQWLIHGGCRGTIPWVKATALGGTTGTNSIVLYTYYDTGGGAIQLYCALGSYQSEITYTKLNANYITWNMVTATIPDDAVTTYCHVSMVWDSYYIPKATASTLSSSYQLWTSNLINSIVSANSVVTGNTSDISELKQSTDANTISINDLSDTISDLSDTVANSGGTYLMQLTANKTVSNITSSLISYSTDTATLPAGTYTIAWQTVIYGYAGSNYVTTGTATPRLYSSDGTLIASGTSNQISVADGSTTSRADGGMLSFTLTEQTVVYLAYYMTISTGANSHRQIGVRTGSIAQIIKATDYIEVGS